MPYQAVKRKCQVNVDNVIHAIVRTTTLLHHDRESSSIYIDRRILPLLLPALEEIFLVAVERNALQIQEARFNDLDNLAGILWNWNPRRSNTISSLQLNVFDIPQFQQWLFLRPQFPKRWLWSKNEAVQCLQKHIRGWLVRKRVDVGELRQFWKDFAEKDLSSKQMENYTILKHSTTILGKSRIVDAYKMHDAKFLQCKMYRRMIVTSNTNVPKVKDSVTA